MPRIGPYARRVASAYVIAIVTVVHCGALPSLCMAEGRAQTPGDAAPGSGRPGSIVLPPRAAEMHRAILEAALSGRIEELRSVFEWNELKPEIAPEAVDDPIAYWRKISKDGEGSDILSALVAILELPPAVAGDGEPAPARTVPARGPQGAKPPPELYVWPYLAARPLSGLTPEQNADLARLMPPEEASAMKAGGRYSGWRLGIGADGTWHFFIRGQ